MIASETELRGKRVTLDPRAVLKPSHVDKLFTIVDVREAKKGPNKEIQGRYLTLAGDDGEIVKWVHEDDTQPARAVLAPGTDPITQSKKQETIHMNADPILSLTNRIAADAKAAGRTIAEHVTSLSADELQPYVTHFGVGGAGGDEEAASEPLAPSDVASLRTVVALLNQPGITPERAVAGLRAHFGGAPSDGPQVTAAQEEFIALSKSIAARDRIDLAQATKRAAVERDDLFRAAYPDLAQAR